MIILVLAILGLMFGSFVNALVWRLHEQELIRDKRQKVKDKRATAKLSARLQELSIARGRSMCSSCGHELAVKDLIPVFSWLWLRGKCRYCGAKIQDNPLPELATAALFVALYLWWPLSFHGIELFQFIIWLGFGVAFVALAVYDLRWFLLPNRIVYPLIGAAALEVFIVAVVKGEWNVILSAALGGLIIYGIFYLLFQLSGGRWIGGGDVKLALVLGLLAGSPLKALLIIFFSSVIGTIVSIPLILRGRKGLQAKIPYGPFLLLATCLVVLFGANVINWYQGLVLR